MEVGFIGLGRMGEPMARRILEAGFPLVVHARRRERADGLLAVGARWAASPAELGAQVDVALTMVRDADAVAAVTLGSQGLYARARSGMVHVDCTTVSPAQAREIARRGASAGVRVVHAPVLGSVQPAREGALTVLLGGDPEDLTRVEPVLRSLGHRLHAVGEHGSAAAMKLAVNLILGVSMQALAEAIALGVSEGLDLEAMLAILAESPSVSSALRSKLAGIRDASYAASFALELMVKDLRLAADTALARLLSLPVTAAAAHAYAATDPVLRGQDFSAVAERGVRR